MFKEIYKTIKKYDSIVIARHIGVDPDAMASQIGLKEAIELTFPDKKVYAVGNGSNKFTYLGKLDKMDDIDFEKSLLIILDTPDKRRVDCLDIDKFAYKIKIDHHPFVEEFCEIEYIDDKASSACEIIIDMLFKVDYKTNQKVMEKLFLGLISDTNRFANSSTSYTFEIVSKMLKEYDLDLPRLYQNLYMRPLSELRLQGYIGQNMQVTENGVGYVKITNDILTKFEADTASAGNMVNSFNYINEVLVWLMITEDKKNDLIKINIRSRGPEVNHIAEKYNGGGHKFACGVKLTTFEEADLLINDLDYLCEKYIESQGDNNDENK